MTAQHAYQPDSQRKENIPTLVHYSSFGKMLYFLRENNHYSQQEVVDAIAPFLRSRKKSIIERRMYGRMEKDERFPAFHELEPMYRALVETLEIPISDVERELYLQLAQRRFAEKRKKKEAIPPEEWEVLAQTLEEIQHPRRRVIRLLEREASADRGEQLDVIAPGTTLRRITALQDILRTDTSHLLERQVWLKEMQGYLMMAPAKKLVVNQGPMGIGKSHALALLAKRLQEQGQEEAFLVPYRFEAEASESKTSDDHLSVFLSTLLADLQQAAPDEARQLPLEQLIDQVLAAIREQSEAGRRIILLLDDAQALFPSPREWAPGCEQFFLRFIKETHTATLFLFTRIWPGWPDRQLTYLAEKELPELSPQAGSVIWQRSGLDDVPQELLEQASIRCGGNPQLMEMRAYQLGRGGTTFAWHRTTLAGGQLAEQETPHQKNAKTRLLEEFLTQDSLFDSRMDVKARQTLQGVITSQLSHATVRVLECLALSPLGVPFSLLEQEFPQMDIALDELVRASLLDLHMAASHRASIVPLAREAQMQILAADGRKAGIEQRVTDLYAYWLTTLQDFRDDSEKAALITEVVVRYMRQDQLLKAAELFIMYGWLCTVFGHISRIQRVFLEQEKDSKGKFEDAKHEAGRLILKHRIAVQSGQKIERNERDLIYQDIYRQVTAEKITLQPHPELEVLHNMRLFLTGKDQSQYTEADQLFGKTIEHLKASEQMTPELYASFLYDKAQLHLSWNEHEEGKQHKAEALHHLHVAANTLEESIPLLRLSLKNALPLQEHYMNFKLARTLNDYAYALRKLGRYYDAQVAIEESIRLKKANAALPHSIAIAQSELSQILLQQGKIQQAKLLNGEAVQLLEETIQRGKTVHQPELGMILVERANILWQQAQLAEALPLLERATLLIGDKKSRQSYKQEATKQIEEIRFIMRSGHPYQLDRRWFPRYSDLVAYDDLFLLTQAGPFTEDEQEEWTRLFPFRDQEESRDRLLELAAQSRKRESICSLQENCTPTISYPCLLSEGIKEDLHERAQGLAALRKEIETQETKAVVRRLYLDAIDEQLTILGMIEAVASKEQEAFWRGNLRLYGKPSESDWRRELKIALQSLSTTLSNARHHKLAGPVAQEILAQFGKWNIPLYDIASEDLLISQPETTQQGNRKALLNETKQFPASTVRKFFADVLNAYGAPDWKVYTSPARDYTYVDPNEHKLVLPQKSFPVAKIRQLLGEEIETHTFRALAGKHSSLALLSLGLARQEATEEGLAKWYIKHVHQMIGAEQPENTWIGTLAAGLAAGVLSPALSFQELRAFLEKYYLLHQLLAGERSSEESLEIARRSAWARACRTFRGVPDLSQAGCCSLKDGIYLRGHLEILHYFECGGDEQRLWVGAVGIDHLNALAELNILIPSFPHQHFALATDLMDQLARYNTQG